MLFSRELLNHKYKEVKTEIENILLKISEETNLLEDDNLARGELVQGVTIRSQWRKYEGKDSGWWSFDHESLLCPLVLNNVIGNALYRKLCLIFGTPEVDQL